MQYCVSGLREGVGGRKWTKSRSAIRACSACFGGWRCAEAMVEEAWVIQFFVRDSAGEGGGVLNTGIQACFLQFLN